MSAWDWMVVALWAALYLILLWAYPVAVIAGTVVYLSVALLVAHLRSGGR